MRPLESAEGRWLEIALAKLRCFADSGRADPIDVGLMMTLLRSVESTRLSTPRLAVHRNRAVGAWWEYAGRGVSVVVVGGLVDLRLFYQREIIATPDDLVGLPPAAQFRAYLAWSWPGRADGWSVDEVVGLCFLEKEKS